jgi:TPR repeat protein
VTRRMTLVALAALAVCASTVQVAHAQFSRDFDQRTIVDVGRVEVAPCTCVAKPFTFPEFRVDSRWGHGPASPMWPGPRPESERAAFAAEAADLAAHIDESVLRAFSGNPSDALRIALVAGAGIGVQIDEANTLSWFVLAAAEDDPAVPAHVAFRVLQGIGIPSDPVVAAQWFRFGADRGDPNAMIALGLLYATGKGVGLNLSTAVRWWIRAGDRGGPLARRLLGDAYACGLGVDQDLARAAAIYRDHPVVNMAFPPDSAGSSLQLARMYRDGCGVARDEKAALKLFDEESQSGNPEAQVEMGEMLLAGAGGEVLADQAYAWAGFAAFRLPPGTLRDRAEKLRRAASTRLTPDARRNADELVAATLADSRPDPARIAHEPGK